MIRTDQEMKLAMLDTLQQLKEAAEEYYDGHERELKIDAFFHQLDVMIDSVRAEQVAMGVSPDDSARAACQMLNVAEELALREFGWVRPRVLQA